MTYETFETRPLTRRIGAEIHGIDLSAEITPAQRDELVRALTQYQVIFFRDQTLSHDDHKRAGLMFGPLAIHTGVAGIPGHPEIVAIHADADSKYVAGETWHSDLSCNAEPPLGSMLYLRTVPDVGGDTLFASMYDAYDALSSGMKQYLAGLTATHDGEHVYRPMTSDPNKRFPCSQHPIVRTHPASGRKCLYVNSSYTTRIDQLPKPESDAILHFLYVHCMNPNFQVRFRWRAGSIALWDNRCTQHQAVWDYFPDIRSGYRVTIAGDRPV